MGAVVPQSKHVVFPLYWLWQLGHFIFQPPFLLLQMKLSEPRDVGIIEELKKQSLHLSEREVDGSIVAVYAAIFPRQYH